MTMPLESSRRRARPARKGRIRYLAAILAASASALSGCETLLKESDTGPWVKAAGSGSLTLSREIRVPKDRARVFLRGGRLSAMGANLGPSCGLEVRRIDREAAQSIPAGIWQVTRIQGLWTEVAQRAPGAGIRLRLAQATDGGGLPMVQEGYHFWLTGGPDGNLMRLTCLGMLDELPDARPPTLAEIRAALGAYATLVLDRAGDLRRSAQTSDQAANARE